MDDTHEQEADTVADKVMSMPQSPPPIQRRLDEEEDDDVQIQAKSQGTPPPQLEKDRLADISEKLKSTKGTGSNLPEATNHQMSRAMGANFSKVSIHTDTTAIQMNRSIGAKAFAHGTDLYFNQGQYNPASTQGQHLLAHELTHVVQQDATNTIRRATTDSATDYRTYTDLVNMTLMDLDMYATTQADWHASPNLTDGDRDDIRTVMSLARHGDNLTTCGNMIGFDFLVEISKSSYEIIVKNLESYTEAVSNQDPFELSPVENDDVAEAVDIGSNLNKLKNAFPPYVLKSAIKEEQFHGLRGNAGVIESAAEYYKTANQTPIFQATNGRDFISYNNMRSTDNRKAQSFDIPPLIGNVRNYHRFTADALDGLIKNFNDPSTSKPLTIILHSSLDHNGAFHRDKQLSAVIKNSKMKTLMLEGKETIQEYQDEISPLAKKHGPDGKIDQVMIAGHGESRKLKFAGKVKSGVDGQLEEDSENIDLDNNLKQTDDLIAEVLANMDDKNIWKKKSLQPHRRIILNACLTNSNLVKSSIKGGSVSESKKAIRKYIKSNPSLTDYIQSVSKSKKKSVIVTGTNASYENEEASFLGASDQLEIISSNDPELTGSKLDYVEHGTEPDGVLRAVLECWVTKRRACKKAMERRLTKEADNLVKAKEAAAMKAEMEAKSKTEIKAAAASVNMDWDTTLITASYQRILKLWYDGERIRKLTELAAVLADLKKEQECRVERFPSGRIDKFNFIPLATALANSTEWSSRHYIGLVVYQAWIAADPSATGPYANFLTQLASKNFNCRTARNYVSFKLLDQGGVITKLLASKNDGALIVALLGIIDGSYPNVKSESKKYLLSILDTNGKFGASLDVPKKLDKLSTEQKILQSISTPATPTPSAGSSGAPPSGASSTVTNTANIKIAGDSKNKEYVESVTDTGEIKTSPQAEVYLKPDAKSKKLNPLPHKSNIYILGETGNWWAIEYAHVSGSGEKETKSIGSAFVQKKDVDLL